MPTARSCCSPRITGFRTAAGCSDRRRQASVESRNRRAPRTKCPPTSNSTMIIQVAIVLFLHHRGFIVAASAAVESKRHQATADHQSEYDADTQERIAPIGQFNVAGVRRPPLVGAEQGRSEQQA